MVRSTYIWLGRVFYWVSAPILFLISLSAHPRVKVIVVDEKGEILLVKNWFGRQRWTLPGGGVKFREPPLEAARRELREELSLDLFKDSLAPLGKIEKYDRATPFQATVFSTEISSEATVYRHPLEIIDHRWVKPDDLPDFTHPSVQRALHLWRG